MNLIEDVRSKLSAFCDAEKAKGGTFVPRSDIYCVLGQYFHQSGLANPYDFDANAKKLLGMDYAQTWAFISGFDGVDLSYYSANAACLPGSEIKQFLDLGKEFRRKYSSER